MRYNRIDINSHNQGFEVLIFDLLAKLVRVIWVELFALALTALSWGLLLAIRANPIVALYPAIVTWAILLKSRRFRKWIRLRGSTARMRERIRSGLTHCRELYVSPTIWSVMPTPSGWRASLQFAPGTSVDDLEIDKHMLATALRCRSVRIMPSKDRADLVDLLISYRDPFLSMPPTPLVHSGDPRSPVQVDLGVDELGNPVEVDLYGNHVLIGGVTGSGKSVVMARMVAAAAVRPQVALFLLDGKGVELSYFRDAADIYSSANLAEGIELLGLMRDKMEQRFDWLATNRRRKLEPGDVHRAMFLVIDELAAYLNSSDRKASQLFANQLSDLLARGRAAGITVIATTQRPSTDLVPAHIRDNFSYRVAMRTTTRDASDTVLGAGWASRGVDGSEIPPSPRGVGYLLAEEEQPRLFRSFYLDDDELIDLGIRAKSIREGKSVLF